MLDVLRLCVFMCLYPQDGPPRWRINLLPCQMLQRNWLCINQWNWHLLGVAKRYYCSSSHYSGATQMSHILIAKAGFTTKWRCTICYYLGNCFLLSLRKKINYTCTLIIRNHHVKIQKLINISRELGHEVVSGQPDLKRIADALYYSHEHKVAVIHCGVKCQILHVTFRFNAHIRQNYSINRSISSVIISLNAESSDFHFK